MIKSFISIDNKKVTEKFVIVSKWGKLEHENKISVSQILHSEPTTSIPNLRDYL